MQSNQAYSTLFVPDTASAEAPWWPDFFWKALRYRHPGGEPHRAPSRRSAECTVTMEEVLADLHYGRD